MSAGWSRSSCRPLFRACRNEWRLGLMCCRAPLAFTVDDTGCGLHDVIGRCGLLVTIANLEGGRPCSDLPHVGQMPGFLCLDRKLVRTHAHPRDFEACDLLGPDQELVQVSSQTGSGPLSHLFAQGIVAAEGLTDRDTWEKFVDLVGNHDAERAGSLGRRPRALVFAIHRSDGLLTPDRLFTFARSELASASILFGNLGIPLQICVIL